MVHRGAMRGYRRRLLTSHAAEAAPIMVGQHYCLDMKADHRVWPKPNAELCLEESKDVKRLKGVKCITAVRIVKFSEISLQNLSSMRSRRPYELHPKVRVFSPYLTTPHTHLSHLEVKRPDVVIRSYDPLRTTLLHAVVRPFLNIVIYGEDFSALYIF